MAQTTKDLHYLGTKLQQLDRYRALVESIQDYAIFLLDENGNVASWNLGAEKFKGYKREEIVGKHFSVFYPPEDIASRKPFRELEQAMVLGRIEDEGWRIRKDGTRFWANVVITALFDSQGKHNGFAKVTRDLTERKKYEDSLREANNKLSVSYQELQTLSLAKDEFVSLASHQLRTPATGVKQYIALLIDGYMGPLTERQLDCLQKAYDSNDRQIEIINDLLQVAQLDAGKVVLRKSQASLTQIIEDIIDEQADTIKSRSQKVSLRLPADPIVGVVDVVRFRMIVENLIDNASKYTPERGEISVTGSMEGRRLKVIIADTGIGIEEADIPRVFEKFTRISSPYTQNINGSGLGLYWVEKIVKLHGGEITIDSVAGEGTTVTLSLPAGASGV